MKEREGGGNQGVGQGGKVRRKRKSIGNQPSFPAHSTAWTLTTRNGSWVLELRGSWGVRTKRIELKLEQRRDKKPIKDLENFTCILYQ